jgi:hypothetical protein
MMRKGLIYLLIFILLLVAPIGIRYLRFYELGRQERLLPEPYNPDNVAKVPTPVASSFMDEPKVGDGLVLLDVAHNNQFTMDEIGYLDGRLAQRGFELLPYDGGDLSAALRTVHSFVVITPLVNYTDAEIQAVSDFVERGGRLLMIGDPTRFNVQVEEDLFSFIVTFETDKIPLNTLSNEFDIIFNGDYLYNTTENEGNFRNILLKEAGFGENNLTEGLKLLAFYGAHSLQIGPNGQPLLSGDDNTWSSATDRAGGLNLAATSRNGRVIALGDIHFLIEPYYTVFDNGRFIAHLADFLTESQEREFVLADFPYFFAEEIYLVYTGEPNLGPDVFDEIITLQEAFRRADINLSVSAAAAPGKDTLYFGLYNESDEVAELLSAAGIELTITPPILTEEEMAEIEEAEAKAEADQADDEETAVSEEPSEDEKPTDEEAPAEIVERLIHTDLGSIQMSGTALLLLQEVNGRYSVVVLAASNQGLENMINRLIQLIPINTDYAFADCLLQDNLALCPTNVTNEEVEAELLPGGKPNGDTAEDDPDSEETGDDTGNEELPGDENGDEETEIDAIPQGTISFDETVEGTLAENEKHAWIFSQGPAFINIALTGDDDMDAILELYDPNNDFITSSDSTFTGETEEILNFEIPDDETYTIVVRDFFADGGSYTLTVTEASEEASVDPGNGIFIFSDDDGTPLSGGVISTEVLTDLLSDTHDVTVWVSTVDGPLNEDTLDGYSLIIWDSGDYLDDEGFFSDDATILLNYLDSGGDIFITGSAPALFSSFERGNLTSVQVNGNEPILLDNLDDGQIIELDQSYETVMSEFLIDDLEDGSIGFLLRGPDSDGDGSVVAVAAPANEFSNQNAVILLFPFVALPAEFQEILVENIFNWFESARDS